MTLLTALLSNRRTDIMKIVSGVILLILFLTSSSIAANYPFALHAVDGDALSIGELGVKQARVAAITWDSIEPQKGNYDFNATDAAIMNLQGAGVTLVVATMRAINLWGGNLKAQEGYDPKDPLTANSGFPSDIGAWKNFIATVVERYDGDGVNDMPGLLYPVKHWQVEGEWMWQWKDTTSNYLNFLDITYKEIKNTDPSAQVIAGAITGTIAFGVGEGFDTRGYFEIDDGAGGSIHVNSSQLLASPDYLKALKKANTFLNYGQNSFDILDIHLYSRDSYSITPAMSWLKASMANFGYLKPVWSLENAGPYYGYSENIHAEEVVKRYLLSISSSIEKIFWSSLHVTQGWAEKYKKLSLLDEFDRRKSAFFTYNLLLSKIDGYDSIEKLNIGEGTYCFKVNRQGALTYIMWSETGSVGSLSLPAGNIRLTDSVTLKTKTRLFGGGSASMRLKKNPIIVEPL